jgi:phosphoribosylamine--glycine ligase
MKVLIIGNGGREHALAWKIRQSKAVHQVYVAPGNAGTALEQGIENVDIAVTDLDNLIDFASRNRINLTIVGPEVPLTMGIVDRFHDAGLRCFGPTANAARLEGSKSFCKEFMVKHQIPTAKYRCFTEQTQAIDYIKQEGAPIVVKADGLAAGKGVVVAFTEQQAIDAVNDMLAGNVFGSAGSKVVIEEFLHGEEASFIVISDGDNALAMASSQDHKARDDGDKGPNTGGMGAYSPAPIVTPEIHRKVMASVIMPTLAGMKADGNPYIGFLYAGLMISPNGDIKVLEYNCRFGDPETQPIMMRLDSDLVELCEAALDGRLGDMPEVQWLPQSALGVVLVAGGYPEDYCQGDVISGLTTEADAELKIFHAGTQIKNGDTVTAGGRVLCVCALGDSIKDAQVKAYQGVKRIHWANMYFRTDIGNKAIM